ncbi:MAG: restriction endonuclease subunit S [Bacteroidetes bacterium]|nr:restriction endonuclease subunit S [Bacteroidota bacterium]
MKQGWEIKKLGEVCKLTNGYAFQSKEYTEDGYFVIRIGNVQDGFIELNNPRYLKLSEEKQKKFILSEGDILVSLTGNVGRVGEIKEEHLPAVLNQRVAKISLNSKFLQKAYLFYFLTSEYFITELIKAGRGAAQQNISTTDIENLIIPLPPLPEQQHIVSILDEAFAAIAAAKANTEQNLKNAKELFESYLQGIFEKKGDGWEEKKLGEVMETGAGGTPLKTFKDYYYGGTIPWLLSGEVSKGEITEARNFITEKGLKNSSAKLFPSNTVLVAMYGATAGQVGILRFEASTNQAVCGIFPNENFLPKFIYYKFLAGKDVLVAQAVGGAQPNISQIKIKNTLVPVISKEKQQTIVRQLDALRAETQKLEAVYQKKIDDLEEMKKSILQKAFAGELKNEKAIAV